MLFSKTNILFLLFEPNSQYTIKTFPEFLNFIHFASKLSSSNFQWYIKLVLGTLGTYFDPKSCNEWKLLIFTIYIWKKWRILGEGIFRDNFEKSDMRLTGFEGMDVFWHYMGSRDVYFFRMELLDKIWVRDQLFFRENRKKVNPMDCLGPLNSVYLTELVFSDQIWSSQRGIFHKKLKKNDITARCFWENRRF